MNHFLRTLALVLSLLPAAARAAAPSYPWTPQDLSGDPFWVPDTGQHAYQNVGANTNGGANASNTPAANGAPVGLIATPFHGVTLTVGASGADASANMPLLASDATRNSSLHFFNASTGSTITAVNSKSLWREIHTTQVYSIQFWVNKDTSVSGPFIWGNSDATATVKNHAGFNFTNGTGGNQNKITFRVSDGTGAASTVASLNSLGMTVGSGWYCVQVRCNGTGGTINGLAANSGDFTITPAGGSPTTVTFVPTASAAASTADAWGDLTLGGVPGVLAGTWKGGISDPVIQKAVATSTELSNYRAFNPPQTTGISIGNKSLVRQLAAAVNGALNAQDVSHLLVYVDARDSTMFFTGAGFTGAVSDGSSVGSIRNKVESLVGLPSGALGYDLAWDSGSGGKAVFNSSGGANAINGKSNLQFNGGAGNTVAPDDSNRQDNNYTFAAFPGSGSGDFTFIACYQNLVTAASPGHTGSDLIAGSDADYARFLGHTVASGASTGRIHFSPQVNGSELTPSANLVGTEAMNCFGVNKNALAAIAHDNCVAGATITLNQGWELFSGGRMGQQANYNHGANGNPTTSDTTAANGKLIAWAYYTADIQGALKQAVMRGMLNSAGVSYRAPRPSVPLNRKDSAIIPFGPPPRETPIIRKAA